MSELHAVGEHLSATAKANAGAIADAYGRSAFNRYYYAAYLEVRELLGQLNADWANQSHANIPKLLEDAVLRKMKTEARKQRQVGAISDSDVERLSRQASSAASAIANTLRTAYSVRVTSDYKPEHVVSFVRGTFSLLTHTDGEARSWLGSIAHQKGILMGVARELGLVS